MKKLPIFSLFFTLYFLASCSNTSFVNDSDKTIWQKSPGTSKQNNYQEKFVTETLLWGIIPDSHEVNLYEVMNLSAYRKVGKLSISEYQTLYQKLLTVFSFGLYIPQTIEVNFWGEYALSD